MDSLYTVSPDGDLFIQSPILECNSNTQSNNALLPREEPAKSLEMKSKYRPGNVFLLSSDSLWGTTSTREPSKTGLLYGAIRSGALQVPMYCILYHTVTLYHNS